MNCSSRFTTPLFIISSNFSSQRSRRCNLSRRPLLERIRDSKLVPSLTPFSLPRHVFTRPLKSVFITSYTFRSLLYDPLMFFIFLVSWTLSLSFHPSPSFNKVFPSVSGLLYLGMFDVICDVKTPKKGSRWPSVKLLWVNKECYKVNRHYLNVWV